jgi:hypothetical protein
MSTSASVSTSRQAKSRGTQVGECGIDAYASSRASPRTCAGERLRRTVMESQQAACEAAFLLVMVTITGAP